MECASPETHVIGGIAIDFAAIEVSLEGAIWHLIAGNDEVLGELAQAVTAEMSFERKLDAFVSLYKLRAPAEAADPRLKSVVAGLVQAQETRNQILHSAWGYSQDGATLLGMKASARRRHGLVRRFGPVDLEQLEAMRERVAKAGRNFMVFWAERVQDRAWGQVQGPAG